MVKVSKRSARIFRARGMTSAYRQGYKAGKSNGYKNGWYDAMKYKLHQRKYKSAVYFQHYYKG